MQITVEIDGKQVTAEVPDDATPEEIDELVNQEAGGPPAAEERSRTPVEFVSDVAGQVSSGLTFGFDDELNAAVGAITGQGKYRDLQQSFDQRKKNFSADHPNTAMLAEGTGAVLPAAAAILAGNPELAPQVSQAGSLLTRLGRNTALGGAAGGLSGIGNSESGEELEGAVRGAAIGGAFGAGGSAAAEAAPYLTKLGEPLQRISRYVEGLFDGGAPGAPTPVRGPQISRPVANKALRSFEQDSTTPAEVGARMQHQADLGKPSTIADVAGENTRGAARATVTLPGPAKNNATQFLNNRQEGQRGRILSDVEQGTRVPATDTDAASRALIQQREINAGPDYARARAQGALNNLDLFDLLDGSSEYAALHRKASRILNETSGEVPSLFDSNNMLVRRPTVQDVDLIKKGIDRRLYNDKRRVNDVDEPALDKLGAAVLESRRTKLLAATDPEAPNYAQARATFAGPTVLNEALETGREFLNMDSRQAARTLQEASPGEREQILLGAVDAVRGKLDNTPDGVNAVRALFVNPEKRAQLRTLFRDEASFARFEQQMESETRMAGTRQHVLGGSQTANKQAEAADAMIDTAGDAIVDTMAGRPKSGLLRVARTAVDSVVGRARAGATEATRGELAGHLFNDNAAAVQDFLNGLEAIRLTRQETMKVKRQFGAGLAVAGGDLLGR